MDKLKEFDLNNDGHTDLGEIAMGIELMRGKKEELKVDLEDYEQEGYEDVVAEE